MPRSSLILSLLAIVSAYLVVTVRHENRLAFVGLNALQQEKQQLQIEQGRLMLERATLSTQHQLAKEAKDRLGMFAPEPQSIVVVQQGGG